LIDCATGPCEKTTVLRAIPRASAGVEPANCLPDTGSGNAVADLIAREGAKAVMVLLETMEKN